MHGNALNNKLSIIIAFSCTPETWQKKKAHTLNKTKSHCYFLVLVLEKLDEKNANCLHFICFFIFSVVAFFVCCLSYLELWISPGRE